MGSKSLCGSRALLLACLLGLLLVAVNADFRSSILRLKQEDLADTSELEFEDPTDVSELLASLPSALTHPEELAATPSTVGSIEDGFAFLQSLPSTDAAGAHVTDFTPESLAVAGAEADAAFELAGVEDATNALEAESDTDALLDELAAMDSFGSLNLSPEVALSFSMSGSMSFSDELSFSLSELMSLSFSGFSYDFSYEFSADFSGSVPSSSSEDFSLSGSGFSDQFSDFSAGNSDFSLSGELSFSLSQSGSQSGGFSDFSSSEDFSDFSGSMGSFSGALSGSSGDDDGSQCTPTRCENGGTCVDGPTGFFCECASHYSGVTCSDFTEPTVARMDPCTVTHVSSDHVYIQWTLPEYPALANLTGFTMTVYKVGTSGSSFYARHMLLKGLLAARIYGLEVDTLYAFEIYARTADDYGLPSLQILAQTKYAAPWGINVLALRDLAQDSMTAFWTYPADMNAYTPEETYFILELSYTALNDDGTSTDYTEVYDGIYEREYTFVGLSSFINYTVTYYAANPFGVSDVWNGLESAILPTSAPQMVGFYALNNPAAPSAYGLSVGDALVVLFDVATNTPALTAATVYNFLQFQGATGTLGLTPSWTDDSTLYLTITSITGVTFPLGEVTVSIGDATSIAAGTRVDLYAAAELGGSTEASSGVSDPVGGNFGFAESFLSFTGTAATDEDVSATFAELGAVFLPGSGTAVLDFYIKPFRAGAVLSVAGLPVGNSSTPLHLQGTPAQLASLFATAIYTPASNMNGYGGLSFSVELNNAQIYFDSLRVLVRPVNDAPVLTMPSTLSVDVDAATAVSGITVTDVDSVLNPLATLKVAAFTNSELHQCWFTAATPGVAYTSGSFSAKAQKVEVTGRGELVQSALRRLNCSFGLDDVMNVPTLTIVVDDQANGATAISTDRSSAIVSSVAVVTVSCVRAALSQPTLTFAADATAVEIRFGRTTQIPSPTNFDCSEWFPAASLATLGTDPMCFGVNTADTHTLTAQLGLGSTVVRNQALTLNAFKRCPTSAGGWSGGSRPVGVPAVPLPPTVVIDAPSQVASCDPLTVTAVPSGTGGRDVDYLWSSSPAGVFSATTRVQQSPTVTPAAGVYTLSVKVTNFVGGESATASTTVTVLGVAAPQIRIQGGGRQSLNYRRTGDIRVGASAELAPCFTDVNRGVDFTWSSANAVATAAIKKGSGTTLILDAATLVPGVYTYSVQGVQQATPAVSGTATLELTILPAPLALVRGSGPFQRYSTGAFAVTPEYSEVSGVTTYTWTCLNSGSPCYNKQTKATFNTAKLNTTFSYAAGTFGPGSYALTHTVTSGSRTFTVPISLEVLAPASSSSSGGTGRRLLASSTRAALPTIAVACTGCQTGTGSQTTPWVVAAGGIAIAFAATVTPDIATLTCTNTYAWEVSPSAALSLASATPNAAYFTLNQEMASPFFALNQQYQLSLTSTATCSDGSVQTGTVTLYFATAKPPVNGKLTTAYVTNSDALPMVLTAANWFTLNVPLTFTFYHRDSAGAALQYITSDIKKPNDVTWARPIPGLESQSFNRVVGVIARDSYGNQATFEKSVRITADVRVVESNATSSVTTTVGEQSGKGSTEGVNQVVAAWGKAFTGAGLPAATVVQLRNLLLTSALTTVSSSSAAAMISSVLAAQGSTSTQIDGNTALLASRIVASALASLTSYGASGAASALLTASQVASNQLTAVSAGASGRRLLTISGDEATKQAVNASYDALYAAMSSASRSVMAAPGQVYRVTTAPVSMTVMRFVASGLSTKVLSASMGPAGSNASVIVPSGLAATGNLDLHLIYTYPNPFTWDAALPTLVSGAVTVRYANTTGALVSSVATGHVTSVYAPWAGSCTGTGCTPACVLWTGQAWTMTGVTTGASSTDGVSNRVRCDVTATTSLPAFTVSLQAVLPASSSAGTSTQTSTGTTITASTGGSVDTTTGSTSTGNGGGTDSGFTEIYFYITAQTSFPDNFNTLIATELATAAKPAAGALVDYVSRFVVMSHENVEVATVGFRTQATKTKVVVHILDSAGGVSSATLLANLKTAAANGLTGTYLSSMTGLVQKCGDGTYSATCTTSGTSSGAAVGGGGTPPAESSSSMGGVIGGVVGGVVVLVLVIGGLYRYKRNRPPKVHDSSSVATDAAAGGNVA